jgi:hypothetical protein
VVLLKELELNLEGVRCSIDTSVRRYSVLINPEPWFPRTVRVPEALDLAVEYVEILTPIGNRHNRVRPPQCQIC